MDMDKEALEQVLAHRESELVEVEKKLESVRADMQKQRLLKEEIRVLRDVLAINGQPSLFADPKTKQADETLVAALRRVLKASQVPLTAPQITERLRKEGRVFKRRDGKPITGTDRVRNVILRYGEDAPEHRRYFRRLQESNGTFYESLEKD